MVVGAGMVAHKLCERLDALGQLDCFRVTIVGEEPCLAYDRVRLSSLFRGGTLADLNLHTAEWFERLKIRIVTGDTVTRIDREQQRVVTASGRELHYDELVLATGSRPIRPPIEGAALPGVHVYRTQADVRELQALIKRSRLSKQPIAIVGAGLLGLELAEAVHDAGADVLLVEASSHLLPRQLSQTSADAARQALERLHFEMFFNARLSSIERGANGRLDLQLNSGEQLRAAGVVFAVGVRPRDELARAAGLRCDLYGGVEVDHHLQTSDAHIHAIGECARYEGLTFGLIAPGYQMAEVLAQCLAGKRARFGPPQPSTHLKMKALELSAVGRSAITGVGMVTYTYRKGELLRTVVTEKNRVVGASAVGVWPEFAQVSGAVGRASPFKPRHARRFAAGKPIWGHQLPVVGAWPDQTVVCSCTGVNCGTLRAALRDGCSDADELCGRTGAGSVCGSCRPLLGQFSGDAAAAEPPPSPWLWGSASLALLAVILISSLPPIPYSTSTQLGWEMDVLWRDDVLKQVSGYTLLGLFALAATFSLRKRWHRLNQGQLSSWRTVHSVIGAAAIVGTVVHTGMRLGENLDFALMLVVFAITVLGSATGLAMAATQWLASSRAMSLRRYWSRLHLWATWPLPVLLAIHIFRAYYF